jgi:flagellar biosynthesis protein FliR
MTPLLADLAAQAGAALWGAVAVFLRVGAALALLPAFGEAMVPARVRLALALGLTAILFPAVAGTLPPGLDAGGVPWRLFATEPLAGLALGAVARLTVVVLAHAGMVAAQSTSLSQLFGGTAGEPMAAMGHLMVLAGLALACAAGLHVHVVAALIRSYQVLPPGAFPLAGDLAAWGVARIGQALGIGLALAAPFVIAALVYNVGLGVINRAMPQLMVAFVGAPAITLGGLVLLALTVPAALTIWRDWAAALLADPFAAP